MSEGAQRVVRTQIPARLDRLPWSRFHWRIVIGLGTVWILDGLEVTIVGSVASRMTEPGSGIRIDAGQIGLAAAIYIVGACLGALFFGQLTDRFGRKKLFMLTLLVYIAATVATAFAFAPWYLYLCRFFTGAGIGGEYAAINSAIDELIPARVRGRVDLAINGSYWVGSMAGSGVALLLLDEAIFPKDVGWRLAFGLGALLGLAILVVRRHVPESPRWLFIHGREEEAERLVDEIEQEVERWTGQPLPEPGASIAVRQRDVIPFREIAHVGFRMYPRRAVLGLALFVGQAFIYNGITFNLGTLITTFYDVSTSFVPVFLVLFAAGNFLGPLVLGRLFDTIGRKPMIAGTYIGSAALGVLLALLFRAGVLNEWSFIGLVMATFFLASAGASAAYLTVSEIFPMETRALAIAFFYALGTAVGGISGPLLFGSLIETANRDSVALAFLIGSVVMAIGGVIEIFLGVKAEGASLEDIAPPLSAAGLEAEDLASEPPASGAPDAGARPGRQEARRARERAEEARARAAEHRARPHELRAESREEGDRRMAEAAERERGARELEDRIRGRIERRQRRDRDGFRRFRPGPGGAMYSPWMSTSRPQETEGDLDHEIDAIGRALDEHGPVDRRELARLVGARYWGPGRFTAALREAVDEGRARRLSRATFAPPGDRPSGGEGASEEESAAAGHGVAGRTGGDR